MLGAKQLNASSCLFLIILMLSFSLSVSNVVDEKSTNKALPISALIINSLVIFLILLQCFGVNAFQKFGELNLVIFFLVLGLSFVLSLTNVTDKDQDYKAFPTIVLVVNSMVVLMVAYNAIMKMTRK